VAERLVEDVAQKKPLGKPAEKEIVLGIVNLLPLFCPGGHL